VRKQISEAQAKEIKNIDAKKLALINRVASTENDSNINFILDNIARFID